MRRYLIILVVMAIMLATPHNALARMQKPKGIVNELISCTAEATKIIAKKVHEKHKKKHHKIDYGIMKCTAYCPCEECSEGYGRRTHTGTTAESGRTVAVDPDVIDLGSKVEIDGETYIAEDTGGAVEGEVIDIFFDTHEEVEEWGTKYLETKVVIQTRSE